MQKRADSRIGAFPVGDVRGYEVVGRNSDESGGSFTVDGADPPHSRASALLQCPRRLKAFGTTQILWETSEVTRVWAAMRTTAAGQSLLMLLPHRIRGQARSYSVRVEIGRAVV